MLPIQKMLININYSKGVTIVPKYIVIHETANTSNGANALANRNYFANHTEAQASTHYVVDDHSIIQCLENNWRAWHVGDNVNHSDITNSNSIGIEICVNGDGDFSKARANAIDLVKYLMSALNITEDRIVRHFDASGKHCPAFMLDHPQMWVDFKEGIKNMPNVKYQAQVQNVGWQNEVSNGATAGTEGKSLRLETLGINIDQGDIEFSGHVQNIGWQSPRHNGEVIGTVGQGLRLEAVKMKLVGLDAYSIQYQCHVEGIGWMDWCKDGEVAGTEGRSLRIEAIKIKVVRR